MDHIGLLLNISELNNILVQTTSLQTILDRCVSIIAKHFESDVCSIYLYDAETKRLTLSSTIGLLTQNGATVSLKLGEGLTGLALEELRPINTAHGSRHPNYRHFPELHEDEFEAYLGVPILRGINRIGVLVIQRKSDKPFDELEVQSLSGVANQLAAMIDYIRLLLGPVGSGANKEPKKKALPSFIKGKAASGGWGLGNVRIDSVGDKFNSLKDADRTKPLRGFDEAVEETIEELLKYQMQIEQRLTDVASLIFSSHILLLKDENFTGKMSGLIGRGIRADEAVFTIADELIVFFEKQPNPYFQQKADDIRDLAIRLLRHLTRTAGENSNFEQRIVVAADIIPSDILILSAEKAAGVVLISGGITSHTAILARSLKIPLVIADVPELLELPESTTMLVDADTGNIFINPSTEIRAPYQKRLKIKSESAAQAPAAVLSVTGDGVGINLMANINLISDAIDANAVGASGVGLYRTEFPFIIRNTFPTEEEQVTVYGRLFEAMKEKPVTFRTLDIGGDKALSYYSNSKESNPFLGMRSIRFCLENRDVLKAQLRAILRAGETADLRIMFPMISSIDELEEALGVLNQCKIELADEHRLYNDRPRVGIMVELPAAIDIIDSLAKRSDFFSIGTNDLIQYLLAVDRTNEKVAKFFCPHHPSVLRAIKRVADAAMSAGIDVSVCGDMAHSVRYLELLIGLGIRTFSIDPLYFETMREAIGKFNVSSAVKLAQRLLDCSTIKGIELILGI